MIDNNYIYEINPDQIELDMDYFSTLGLRLDKELEISKMRLDASEDSYTQFLYQKYPCLSPIINFYKFPSNWTLEMHVDSNRQCALNIPVKNTKDTDTVFYDFVEEPILEHNLIKKVHFVKSKVVESFRFSMTNPVLINVTNPHSVINSTQDYRISISWSMKPDITFEQAKSIFIATYNNNK